MRLILFGMLLLTLRASSSFALSQGPLFPSTGVNQTGIGTDAWVDPGNITSNNDQYAVFSDTGGLGSNYLKATGFSFSIPSDATITAITVTQECKANFDAGGASGRRIENKEVRLVKADTIVGNALDYGTGGWSTTDETIVSGEINSMALWGVTFTPAEVNAADFGAVLAAEANRGDGDEIGYVDSISITVYYEVIDALAPAFFSIF